MKATINFEFCGEYLTTITKEITVEDTEVIATVNSEINKYLKENNYTIYGDEDLGNSTCYEGDCDITVQITRDNKKFSVSEFEDFQKWGFKYPEDDYDDYWSCEDDYYGDDDYSNDCYCDYDDNNV